MDEVITLYILTRNAFLDFVKFYNEGNQNMLDIEQTIELKKLHSMWKEISISNRNEICNEKSIDFFHSMKKHHQFINGIDSDLWKDYINKSMNFKLTLMQMQFHP